MCHFLSLCSCVCVLTCMCSSELSTPVCCGELRRWSHGGYTLLHDGEAARTEYALDLVLPFGCAGESSHTRLSINTVTVPSLESSFIDWQSEFGGFTCYVANEEDEEVSADYKVSCLCVHEYFIDDHCFGFFLITASDSLSGG